MTSGTTAYNSTEWDTYATDYASGLGTHTVVSSNNAPTVTNPIADISAAAGGSAVVIDATNTFADADSDTLTLTAASSQASIATVSVSGKQLTVTPVSVGTSSITVTANDGHGGTVSDTFAITVTAASTVLLNETFESGTKGAYANGSVTLSTGSWAFNNALIGNLSTDKKNGLQSARIRASGSLDMNFNAASAKEVKFFVANFGSDSGATWKLQKSVNNGSTWTDVTAAVTASATLTEQIIAVNEASSVRFRIVVSGTSGQRLNIDDVRIVN
ncbi:Ig-like domain-containing protein [Paenibacillus chartarius]|uniref:Ig-like domain-containing protein n=1 Tax=Paenibacillus chartarius TaxID=747481 RepID=A0ABV6DV60_9BACL